MQEIIIRIARYYQTPKREVPNKHQGVFLALLLAFTGKKVAEAAIELNLTKKAITDSVRAVYEDSALLLDLKTIEQSIRPF